MTSLTFVAFDLLLHELLPFANISLSTLSCILAGVMPLTNLLGPVGDMYCFSNTYRLLVIIGI